ncbi:MAG: Wzz/FepE/Etk N-terminal domain-containing protein [Eggerthellaceae bacterium]|jgi:capsular polysaccharide biosynthesis protein
MTIIELFELLKKHLKFVIALPIVCAIAVGLYSFAFMDNQYTASTSMYVLANQAQSSSSSSNSNTLYNDLNASQMLTNDVAKLLKGDQRLVAQVSQDTGVPSSGTSLAGYKVQVTNETNSRVISLSVTGSDPQKAAAIANAMTKDVSEIAQEVMGIEAVNQIDQASAPASPSGPNRPLYILVGFLVGLFAAMVIVVVADMFNTRVRSQADLEQIVDVPVLGRIPEIKGAH